MNAYKNSDTVISHLYQDDSGRWAIQTNGDHAKGVADLASVFADEFGMASWGRMLGLLHDIGKERKDFQKYIRCTSGYDPDAGAWGDKDHSFVGAVMLHKSRTKTGYILSNCLIGHHRGLYDTDELEHCLERPLPEDIPFKDFSRENFNTDRRFRPEQIHHLTRMLFSCLVDADYLDTERFMNEASFRERGIHTAMSELLCRITMWHKRFDASPASEVNQVRAQIQKLCVKKAAERPGFFELTVPTGGGKTVASVLWAVNHAFIHGKKRIVVAIPYTSIIVQTAQILRDIFGEENVIEHHSMSDEYALTGPGKLACENWDAPIIVTTNVQLFESMFANRPRRCRKLHSLCNSVIILDEVQSLPLALMQPIVDALKTYVEIFGSSVMFCTASQPVLDGDRKGSGCARFKGILPDLIRPVIPASLRLHEKLRRVRLTFQEQAIDIPDICRDLISADKVLCIVNTRRAAAEIFRQMPSDDEVNFHLSKMMCPLHIKQTLNQIRDRLAADLPVRVISTQLIEAGVDIDFPKVLRQMAGLDSIIQAAGRCNREGRIPEGDVTVFNLKGIRPVGYISFATDAMRQLLSTDPGRDWFDPETIKEYFRLLYSRTPSFDKHQIAELTDNPRNTAFEEAAERLKLIDETGISVIVNYGEADSLIAQLRNGLMSRQLVRRLGQYTVTISRQHFKTLQDAGLIETPADGFNYVSLKSQYDPKTGLKTGNDFLEQTYII